MDPQPSLELAWQDYCNTLYPCADARTVSELRRTFFAGALVFEGLLLQMAAEKGLLKASEDGEAHEFLEALAPLREELHSIAEKLAEDPGDGA
jgi:hypothetical protein